MIKVNYYDWNEIEDSDLLFVVIVSRFKDKWVLARHEERSTWEIPGGHRESGENIDDAAKRELYEETGAKKFKLIPICIYSVDKEEDDITRHSTLTYGGLYFSDIEELGDLPDLEIDEIKLCDELPKELTYPDIQPHLLNKVIEFLNRNENISQRNR